MGVAEMNHNIIINHNTYTHVFELKEHFYHILESNKLSLGNMNEVISPDPDAPELPSPLQPDSQDTSDTSPLYQDIKLSCKPNEVTDCERCCYQEHMV